MSSSTVFNLSRTTRQASKPPIPANSNKLNKVGCCAPDPQILGSWTGNNDTGTSLTRDIGKDGYAKYRYNGPDEFWCMNGNSFVCCAAAATSTTKGYFSTGMMCPFETFHYAQPKQDTEGVWWVEVDGKKGSYMLKKFPDRADPVKAQPTFASPTEQVVQRPESQLH